MLPADEGLEALVVLPAGRAAGEVRPEAGQLGVRITPGELQFDVPVQVVEALVASDLRPGGTEQPAHGRLQLGMFHQSITSSRGPSSSRSFRLASCRVL